MVSRNQKCGNRFHISRDFLIEKYTNQRLAAYKIAREVGCAKVTVFYALRKYGIPIRDQREGLVEYYKVNGHRRGFKATPETRYKQRLAKLGKTQTRESIRNRLHRRERSSLEVRFQSIIDKYNLPYRFVGNGEVFVGKKNPDFTHTSGEKKAVEVYARRHKQLFRGRVEEWKRERNTIFADHGWQLVFFDETELNPDNEGRVLERLGCNGV